MSWSDRNLGRPVIFFPIDPADDWPPREGTLVGVLFEMDGSMVFIEDAQGLVVETELRCMQFTDAPHYTPVADWQSFFKRWVSTTRDWSSDVR